MTLTVADQPPIGTTRGGNYWWYPLTTWDYTTSVRETGQPISITGLPTDSQIVVPGKAVTPFASAFINDDSTNAAVSVSISEDNPTNGSLSGSGINGSSGTLSGYVKDVTNALNSLVFTPSVSATTTFTLTLRDDGIGETATATIILTPQPQTPPPIIAGTAQEGQTLTASDNDTSATFQWQSLVNGTWTPISGATGSTYTVAEGDENNVLRVEATGTAGKADSAATAKVIDVTPTLSVAVSGTAQEAQVLTATPTLGTDNDDSANSVTYQWQRSNVGVSSLGEIPFTYWTYISGATANTYTATEGDENHFLRAVASFTDDTGQTVAVVSSATATVTDVPPSLTVSLSGIPQDGKVLTAVPAVITDGDNSAADVTYQWQWSTDNATWNNISGATGGSYSPTDADVGRYLRAVASFADDTGQSATANSPGTLIPCSGLSVFDTTTGQSVQATGQPYPGPVSGITCEYINITPHSLNVGTSTPNWYIHTGDGNDGLNVSAGGGTNILAAEGGSNFLVGGTGNDTFFVNGLKATVPSWNTIVGFHKGDAVTAWGVTPQDFHLFWQDNGGAAGYNGATLYGVSPTKPEIALTLAGETTADIASGVLNIQFGTIDVTPGSHTPYMEITHL
jgi:hypothetical protein